MIKPTFYDESYSFTVMIAFFCIPDKLKHWNQAYLVCVVCLVFLFSFLVSQKNCKFCPSDSLFQKLKYTYSRASYSQNTVSQVRLEPWKFVQIFQIYFWIMLWTIKQIMVHCLNVCLVDSSKTISETWVSRQRLEDIYKKVLLTDLEYALDKKVEQEL